MPPLIPNAAVCKDFFNPGGCPRGDTCLKRHDIFKCSCDWVMLLDVQASHLRGQAHRKRLAEVRRKGEEANVVDYRLCPTCVTAIVVSEFDAHIEEHQRRKRIRAARRELEATAEDKEGVQVTGLNGVSFGVLEEPPTEMTVEMTLTITTEQSIVILKSAKMRSSTRSDQHGVKFSVHLRGNSKRIDKTRPRTLAVVFHPSDPGHYEDVLELLFFHLDNGKRFIITRNVEAVVGNREDHEQLRPTAPYQRQNVPRYNLSEPIIPSLRPPAWTQTVWADRLPLFPLPAKLIEAVYGANVKNPKQAVGAARRLMPSVFNSNTYGKWFQNLLYWEEERVRLDLDLYSLLDVELEPNYPRYKLKVAGLAENRPSVLVGDFINVSHTEPEDSVARRTWYQGRVHKVYESHVSLRFGEGFSTYRGTKFDVRFVLNRLPFRRMHQVLVIKTRPARFLFPTPELAIGMRSVTAAQMEDVNPYFRSLKEDDEQLETVTAILNQKAGSPPFIIFGPPGTGKTQTLVEAILQLLDKDPDIKILACAPNNNAADLIANKLKALGTKVLYRLNSLSRKIDTMDKVLHPFSSINGNEFFAMPELETLKTFRVVVSTCLSGGVPASLGVARGHFSHIFVDEAGQGKEPELMVPILSIADDKTNVVLAGDNHQLGPVVHSEVGMRLGLKTSYLSRLMGLEVYDLKKNRGKTIVKLVKSFRSHPSIMEFSNNHFYDSELQPCGNPAITHSLANYEELPKKQFPVVFHGIQGRDMREASSPSFFNPEEASEVKKYVVGLVGGRKSKLKAEHIGIITPYHAQRCKILDLLHKDPKTRDIKVGTVEEFQGQERRVIIISTVRSNKDFIAADIRRSLGFVADRRRMNVALTRAQALLIVIGNPIVLSLDPLWRAFMNFVFVSGGWKGLKPDWNPAHEMPTSSSSTTNPGLDFSGQRRSQAEQELDETIERLRAMIVDRHTDEGLDIDFGEDDDAGGFERGG
ncbi:RNA helicase [Panaeolus papilionaceus]|nr:RNA helicase [Panaeolus papilionaceus]